MGTGGQWPLLNWNVFILCCDYRGGSALWHASAAVFEYSRPMDLKEYVIPLGGRDTFYFKVYHLRKEALSVMTIDHAAQCICGLKSSFTLNVLNSITGVR